MCATATIKALRGSAGGAQPQLGGEAEHRKQRLGREVKSKCKLGAVLDEDKDVRFLCMISRS